jgi:hypothetical protein
LKLHARVDDCVIHPRPSDQLADVHLTLLHQRPQRARNTI